jgi:hypothetical protein
MNTLSPPQKKSGFLKQPSGQQVKQMIVDGIQSQKINPTQVVQLGQMAQATIKDPALYEMLKQQSIQAGVLDDADFGKGVNYQLLATMVAVGKVAEKMSGGM